MTAAARAFPVPPPRFSHPGRRSGARIPVPVPGGPPGPHHGPEVVRPRWGCCPADRLLHLLDPTAVHEAVAVGWAQARCTRPDLRRGSHAARHLDGVVRGLPSREQRAMSSTARSPRVSRIALMSGRDTTSPPER